MLACTDCQRFGSDEEAGAAAVASWGQQWDPETQVGVALDPHDESVPYLLVLGGTPIARYEHEACAHGSVRWMREHTDACYWHRSYRVEGDASHAVAIPRCPSPRDEVRYTTAEESYDGFGTMTLRVVGHDTRSRDIREVAIEPRHLRWQSLRYHSGLHGVWDRDGVAELALIAGYEVNL